jgi:uncharacterized membrane protein
VTDLLVLTFDDADEAEKVRGTFVGLHHDGALEVVDSVIVTTDADGQAHVVGSASSGARKFGKRGALVGGLLAVALPGIGLVAGAAAGLAVGAFGGGILGAATIDRKFVDEVTASLTPGTSALFVVVRNAKPGVVAAALRPYHGRVHQTTLPGEVEEAVSRALE